MFLLRIFVLRYNSTLSGFFHGAFQCLLLFTKKFFRTYHFAPALCATIFTQSKQDRTTRCVFFDARIVSVAVRQTTRACSVRKTSFRTRKRFHNKQYTPKSKDKLLESERTRFYVRFNNSNVAMHRPTILFFFRTKSQPFNKTTKTNNQINQPLNQSKNQPRQTTTTNYPHTNQSTIRSKQNMTNKHEKQSHQSIVKSITQTIQNLSINNTLKQTVKTNTTYNRIMHQDFLIIKISQPATAFEPTANILLIKLNAKTQANRGNNGSGQDTTNTK